MAGSAVSQVNEAAAREATPSAGKAGPAAARLPVSSLQLHPVLAKLPVVLPLELPGGAAASVGPAHPLVVNQGKVILVGREQLELALARGDQQVDAVVVDLAEDAQLEVIFSAARAVRRLSDGQLAVVAAYWCDAEVRRSKAERAGKGGTKKAAKKSGCSGDTVSTEQKNGAARPRALQRAVKDFGLPERLVRAALDLVRQKPGEADRVLAGEVKLKSAVKKAKAGPAGTAGGRPAAAARSAPEPKAAPAKEPAGRPPAAAAAKGRSPEPEPARAGGAKSAAPPAARPEQAAEVRACPPAPSREDAADAPTLVLRRDQPAAEVAERLLGFFGAAAAADIAEKLKRKAVLRRALDLPVPK
jgi:hypothetical protein